MALSRIVSARRHAQTSSSASRRSTCSTTSTGAIRSTDSGYADVRPDSVERRAIRGSCSSASNTGSDRRRCEEDVRYSSHHRGDRAHACRSWRRSRTAPAMPTSGSRPKLAGEFTPTASDEIAKGPVPRMPDGKPDLHGPWVGGGSNSDIEVHGRAESGRTAAAAVGQEAARQPPGGRRALSVLHADGRAARQPVPVELHPVGHVEGAGHHLCRPRERRRRSHPPHLHGRPEASRRSDPVVVRPFDRAMGKGHAGDRHDRLQRQVLDGQPRHAAHRADAHDRTVDAHHLRDDDERLHARRSRRVLATGAAQVHGAEPCRPGRS